MLLNEVHFRAGANDLLGASSPARSVVPVQTSTPRVGSHEIVLSPAPPPTPLSATSPFQCYRSRYKHCRSSSSTSSWCNTRPFGMSARLVSMLGTPLLRTCLPGPTPPCCRLILVRFCHGVSETACAYRPSPLPPSLHEIHILPFIIQVGRQVSPICCIELAQAGLLEFSVRWVHCCCR